MPPKENDVLRTFTRDLPVELNEHELQLYGKMLAEKIQEEQHLEEKKKQISAEYTTQIKAVRVETARLADARTKGKELRAVTCIERFRNGVVEMVRTDKGEVFDVRPADTRDLQTNIPGTEDDDDIPPGPPPGTDITAERGRNLELDDGPRGDGLGDDHEAQREREPALVERDGALLVDGDPGHGEIVGSSTGANVYHQPDEDEKERGVRLDLEEGSEVVDPIDDSSGSIIITDASQLVPVRTVLVNDDGSVRAVVDESADSSDGAFGSPWADESYAQRKAAEATQAAAEAAPTARERRAKNTKAGKADKPTVAPKSLGGGKKKRK